MSDVSMSMGYHCAVLGCKIKFQKRKSTQTRKRKACIHVSKIRVTVSRGRFGFRERSRIVAATSGLSFSNLDEDTISLGLTVSLKQHLPLGFTAHIQISDTPNRFTNVLRFHRLLSRMFTYMRKDTKMLGLYFSTHSRVAATQATYNTAKAPSRLKFIQPCNLCIHGVKDKGKICEDNSRHIYARC